MCSLSGVKSALIAVGGKAKNYLNNCELYAIRSNKWRQLPHLSIPRSLSASILFDSMKALCFQGALLKYNHSLLGSIEGLQIGCEERWRILAVCEKIKHYSSLVAASFENKIVLFGGQYNWVTFVFSEEAELLQDLSSRKKTYTLFYPRVFTCANRNIYTVEKFKENYDTEWRLKVFNGSKWAK